MASGDTRKVILKNKDDEYLIPYTEVASSTTVGRVKPDGTTTSVDSTGAMSVIGKQDTLVSGTNIKTINGASVLGSGDLSVSAQVSFANITGQPSDNTNLATALNAKADDSAVVKLTGNQTISGQKTFTTDMYSSRSGNFGAFHIKNTNYDYLTNPSAAQYQHIVWKDKNNKDMSYIQQHIDTNGTVSFYYTGSNYKTDGTRVNCAIGCHVNRAGSIWTSAPTPASADNSTKIATTAYVKAQGYALDSAVVKLSGNQTIADTKTFSSSPVLPTPATSDNSTKGATTAYVNNKFQVVTALPASPDANTFYFVTA